MPPKKTIDFQTLVAADAVGVPAHEAVYRNAVLYPAHGTRIDLPGTQYHFAVGHGATPISATWWFVFNLETGQVITYPALTKAAAVDDALRKLERLGPDRINTMVADALADFRAHNFTGLAGQE